MITYLQLTPKPRKRGSIHPLPHTPSWRSAWLVKHRNNFCFFFCLFSVQIDFSLYMHFLLKNSKQLSSLIIGLCIQLYVETSVRNKCRCSFYCALFTLHVSAPIDGHLQVVCTTKNSKSVTVYVNGSVASIRTKANAVVGWVLTIYVP
jgi:hypothetical protein